MWRRIRFEIIERKPRGTSPPRKCCPAANGARRHGERQSRRPARGNRARFIEANRYTGAAVRAERATDSKRRVGIAAQPRLLILLHCEEREAGHAFLRSYG